MLNRLRFLLIGLLAAGTSVWATEGVMEHYQAKGTEAFNAARGEALWKKSNPAGDGSQRSCGSCHGDDLSVPGKHAKTGKKIEPMARSANAERYTELKKVEKWFTRNCKWTMGRTCTDQEKGDFLAYLFSL